MSSDPYAGLILPENMVRDFEFTDAGAVAGQVHDCPSEFAAVMLDLYIRNRGAAALTVSTNGQGAITVDPGDVYILNHVKFWTVTVVSAVLYDFQLFGVKESTLKRRGLMKG